MVTELFGSLMPGVRRILYMQIMVITVRLPLWSGVQSSWLQIPELSDFLRSNGSGMGVTQPCGGNWGAAWMKDSGSCLENRDYRSWRPFALTTQHPQKLALTSPTSGGRLVGVVCLWTKCHRVCFFLVGNFCNLYWIIKLWLIIGCYFGMV
jgi:hypothetical protein